MKVLLVLFSITILLSCKGGEKDILPIDKMKVVFLHHIMTEEMINNHYANRDTTLSIDSLQIVSFDHVLKLNATDSSTFYKSLAYYKGDVKRFKELLDSTHAYADKLRQELYLKIDTPTEDFRKSKDLADSIGSTEDSFKVNEVDSLVK
jgi:hypothetical protein